MNSILERRPIIAAPETWTKIKHENGNAEIRVFRSDLDGHLVSEIYNRGAFRSDERRDLLAGLELGYGVDCEFSALHDDSMGHLCYKQATHRFDSLVVQTMDGLRYTMLCSEHVEVVKKNPSKYGSFQILTFEDVMAGKGDIDYCSKCGSHNMTPLAESTDGQHVVYTCCANHVKVLGARTK